MFTVSYRFKIHSKQNELFEESWKEVTQLIYEYCGSLGSRLYKSDGNSYFGIAQWPDKQTWEESNLEDFDTNDWRSKMRACCESMEKLDELELIHDLWAEKAF
ncbi:antibiotic biosynthesis monooxygenase [Fluviicola taffensis]|uniref:Antibiotic biosynthesis monooxygenase domain-containing protein n=1 Tax=Fluviicola taffensis (strain DSM 16823 / NCIMB 13979 / RW262) TaxID=755732 RepID=F2IDA0_FLUTR|nr:antibiotic biosynthesis monooxygenase [Fluviicola taffensis]AEA45515.1 antibiotic biosynthesis monooxygenase domain-containing protein [Fluviicola taffensis DSM 16823]